MLTPSQARKREGVEALQAAPKAIAKVKTKSRPRTARAAKAEVVSQGRNAGALPARGILYFSVFTATDPRAKNFFGLRLSSFARELFFTIQTSSDIVRPVIVVQCLEFFGSVFVFHVFEDILQIVLV